MIICINKYSFSFLLLNHLFKQLKAFTNIKITTTVFIIIPLIVEKYKWNTERDKCVNEDSIKQKEPGVLG